MSSQLELKYSSRAGHYNDNGEKGNFIEYAEAEVKLRFIPLKEGHQSLPKFRLMMKKTENTMEKGFSKKCMGSSQSDDMIDPNNCSVRWYPSSQPKVIVHPVRCIKTSMMLVR
eukprot:jgi/Bigna1/135972/aug1.31_g10680